MYNKIFKNNQVTYGRPYQVKIPINFQNNTDFENDAEEIETDDISFQATPEELLENARHKCEMIQREAELEADRLLEEAKQDAVIKADAILEEAWQKGYAEGLEAAASQNRAVLSEAEEIRRSAAEEHESMLAGMEAEMISLVIEVARKAVAGELATNREIILQLVRDALPNCSNKEGALLRVSPQDGDYLNENRELLLTTVEGAEALEIKKDNSLKPGDCIIETFLGNVDAGVSTRMDKIEEAYMEELEGK